MNLTDKEAPIESSSSSTSSLERLNEGLSLFDAILIVPMFQITWTFFSIFSALHNTTLLMHLQFLSCLWCHQSMQAFEETRLTEQRSSPSEMLSEVFLGERLTNEKREVEEGNLKEKMVLSHCKVSVRKWRRAARKDQFHKGLTWNNRRMGERNVQERLDRYFASEIWMELFSDANVKYLGYNNSDHRPIALNTRGTRKAFMGRDG
ncbi:hypothetical protein QYF36_024636 [Acer negundo]|nr:hypothetical protein QYF36_024636 [Acer negundo]